MKQVLGKAEARCVLCCRVDNDTGLSAGSANAAEVTLGHNVKSKAEVDAVMARAKKAGAIITKAAHETFWGGYSGYFQDPDGHLWEIVWNLQWTA